MNDTGLTTKAPDEWDQSQLPRPGAASWMVPLIIASLAAIIGGLIGWFLISIIVRGLAEMLNWSWLQSNARSSTMLLTGFLNGWASFHKQRASLNRQRQRQSLGAQRGLTLVPEIDVGLVDAIEELFGGNVMLSGSVLQRDLGSTKLAVTDVRVTHHRESDKFDTACREYTVAFVEDPGLDFPDFQLQPRRWLASWAHQLAGYREFRCENHPAFSKRFHLTGVSHSNLNDFFDPPLLDYFAQLDGWQVHARQGQVLVWRANASAPLVDPGDIEEFVDQAFEIFTKLRERQMDWEKPADCSANDYSETEFDGLASGVFERHFVCAADIRKMIHEPTPRRWLPAGIKRDKFGFPAVPLLGLLFIGSGILFSVIGLSASVQIEGGPRWLVAVFGCTLLIAGIPVLIGGCWYRYRWNQLLRRGKVALAEVQGVERTDAKLNNQRRFWVSVKYQAEGHAITNRVAVYGRGGKIASQALKAGRMLHVIYDSTRPQKACLAEGFINS